MHHWLMKSEPDVFGIEHLRAKGTASWDGVRNFAARNHMVAMAVGDRVLFYHSSAEVIGVAGIAEVARIAYPDHTAWDPKSEYFDARSTPEKPMWQMVDVRFVRAFPRVVTLAELRARPELADLMLFTHGRLSVLPVAPEHFALIEHMAEQPMATVAAMAKPKPASRSKPKREAKPRAKAGRR
jgi:predicted RNA-binding protein with PUA-like domain